MLQIRKLRLDKDWSIHELARRAGVPYTNVALIERGHKLPRRDELEKIAAAFQTTVEELYSDS